MNKYDKKQIILMLCPAIFSLIIIAVTPQIINTMVAGLSQKEAYWIVRSKPFFIMSLIPASSLLFTKFQKLHLRKYVIYGCIAVFSVAILYYGSNELSRLSQYVGQNGMMWKDVLPYFDHMLLSGIIAGFVFLGFSIKLSKPPSPIIKNAKKSPLGSASWLPIKDVVEIFPDNGDVIVGERYRVDEDSIKNISFSPVDKTTWGKGGKEPLMTYKMDFGSTHSMFFAGSGGYKTTSTVIPTCLSYQGPIICLDPSTEVAPIVKKSREKILDRTVMVLDPNGNSTKAFNVLDWLLDESVPLPQREANIANFARLLMSNHKNEDASSNYFSTQAHNLLTGLLAHVIFSDEYEDKDGKCRRTLKELRKLISQPEPNVIRKLQAMHKESDSDFIKETIGVFTNMTEQTFSGVYSTASKDTQWLSLSNYAYLVCGGDFKSADIAKGKMDVFLNIPSSILNSYPGIGRVIVGAFLNSMVAADGRYAKRVLFVLDEVDLLGYMNVLEEARDRGRKYGTSLMLFYQSTGQLINHFGESGARSWFESCSFVSYAAIKDLETAKEVSERCGQMTIEVKGTNKPVGIFSHRGAESVNLQHRPLILPHEIIQDMRQDEQIILMQGKAPIRCGRAIYFRRKELLALANENRFAPKKI